MSETLTIENKTACSQLYLFLIKKFFDLNVEQFICLVSITSYDNQNNKHE